MSAERPMISRAHIFNQRDQHLLTVQAIRSTAGDKTREVPTVIGLDSHCRMAIDMNNRMNSLAFVR
jgi:hypothetical protein